MAKGLAPVMAADQTADRQPRYAINLNLALPQSKVASDYCLTMPLAAAQPASPPRRAIVAQAAICAAVLLACALAPRTGQAAIYLPLVAAPHHEVLDWALAHGALVMGTGPAGGADPWAGTARPRAAGCR
ncbi:MAG: hypothetical protein ACKVOL_03965 [Novosphingobium sp.]